MVMFLKRLPLADMEWLPHLPNPMQELLLATRTIEEVNEKKLAARFKIPEGTVKSRLSRARAEIKKLKAAHAAGQSYVVKVKYRRGNHVSSSQNQ